MKQNHGMNDNMSGFEDRRSSRLRPCTFNRLFLKHFLAHIRVYRPLGYPDLEIRSCGNAVLLNLSNGLAAMVMYNSNMPLLCYIIHLFYINPVLVAWWRIASQSRAFDTNPNIIFGRRTEIRI